MLRFILISVAILLVITSIFIIVLFKRRNKTTEITEYPNLLIALGGKENINQITYKASRVSIVVNDKKIIDKDKIKEEAETIVVSNKKITMVVGNKKAISISSYLNEQICL